MKSSHLDSNGASGTRIQTASLLTVCLVISSLFVLLVLSFTDTNHLHTNDMTRSVSTRIQKIHITSVDNKHQQQKQRQLQETTTTTTVSGEDVSFDSKEFKSWIERLSFSTPNKQRTSTPRKQDASDVIPILQSKVKPKTNPVLVKPKPKIKPVVKPIRKPVVRSIVTQKPVVNVNDTIFSSTSASSSISSKTTIYCTCTSCTEQRWNGNADGITCGARILWVKDNDPSVQGSLTRACTKVSTQFPTVCGVYCDPMTCPKVVKNTPTISPTKYYPGNNGLYCYPDGNKRKKYTNVWSSYTVEVRESSTTCDPSSNMFNRSSVQVNGAKNELRLQYKQSLSDSTVWIGSEVRTLLQSNQMPYSYGTYKFRIKSIEVKNSKTNIVKSNTLPPSLVLGFFTWDPTDDYSIRENYNHEVDIEFSKWKNTGRYVPDGLFLVQPSGQHAFRFYTGTNQTSNPGNGSTYQFIWNPNTIVWSSSNKDNTIKHAHTYSTADAVRNKKMDYVQCLPANMDIRFNLWNLLGTKTKPMEMIDGDVVSVIIDYFNYTKSSLPAGVPINGICTRSCQCQSTLSCQQNKCIKK